MNLFMAIHSYHSSAGQVTTRYKASDEITYRKKIYEH